MDRALSRDYILKRRKKRFISIAILVTILFMVGIVFVKLSNTNVDLSKVLISKADQGNIETSFATQGIVEPFYQELLTSGNSTEILQITHATGDLVGPNDTIFILNTDDLLKRLENTEREILLKKNQIARSKEELNQKQSQLKNQMLMDSIQLEHLKSKLDKEKYLLEIGGGSEQNLEQAKIDYKLAGIQGQNQKNDFESFKKLQVLDLKRMELELQLKMYEKDQIQSEIDQAFVKPKIKGILTSVLVEPGQYVNSGQSLAHVADAERFKIEGSITSRYANQIFVGQKAKVLVNDSVLNGQLMAISPSVSNGSIDYTVMLDEPEHSLLKAKQQVEVRIILSEINNTVRIANGDFYSGPGSEDMFVKNGEKLEKRKVKLGGADFKYVQVISGIAFGEEVVVSKSFNEKYHKYTSLTCSE